MDEESKKIFNEINDLMRNASKSELSLFLKLLNELVKQFT